MTPSNNISQILFSCFASIDNTKAFPLQEVFIQNVRFRLPLGVLGPPRKPLDEVTRFFEGLNGGAFDS